MKRNVQIEIAGARYRMSSDADEAYLQRLADIVNERVEALGPKAARAATPAQLLAVVALISLASVSLGLTFEIFDSGSGVDPAWAAAIRTAILSLGAIILAALGSKRRLLELTWLVYPVLVVTGVKLVFEDLRHGNPLALFVSFAFLGVALIIAPRLLRRPK